jgi:hypothetical protein
MNLLCPTCRRSTPHRVLLHTIPAKMMCYECGTFGEYRVPSVPAVKAPANKRHPSCQRCYSAVVGGDCLFGECIEGNKPATPS